LDEDLIDARIEVKRLIEQGLLDQAIAKINQINPELLDKSPDLYFELKR